MPTHNIYIHNLPTHIHSPSPTTASEAERLQSQLDGQLRTLQEVQDAVKVATDLCNGHQNAAEAVKSAEREALRLGESVARLEDTLAERQEEADRQLKKCEELAIEARAVRKYVAIIRNEVTSLRQRAKASGIEVDLRALSETEANTRLDALLNSQHAELRDVNDRLQTLQPRRHGPEHAADKLSRYRGLHKQEATLRTEVEALKEESMVNDEVIEELERQLRSALEQLGTTQK